MKNRPKSENIQHTILDWYAIHGISHNIESLIAYLKSQEFIINDRSVKVPDRFPPTRDALSLVELSLKLFFTKGSTKIEASFSEIDFQVGPGLNDPNAPYTVDHGAERAPTILCAYRESPEDLVALAHECAHAVQLTLSKGAFMPPIQREVCAFVGEQILIDFAATHRPDIADSLRAVWDRENETYFGEDTRRLADAARDENSPYAYRWNYPVARMAATELFKELSPDELWSFFEGDPDLWADYLGRFSTPQKEYGMENYYPQMPQSDAGKPMMNAYRAVGAMALMDADYWSGLSETPIGEYCDLLVKNMQSGTAFICVGDDMKPVGYATWDAEPDGITLTHRCAPFGDYLKLMKSLQARVPNSQHARSTHERSARKEQVAW